jgi:RNA polymerase-binding transcription factor DksA
MTANDTDLRSQVDELKAENERLRKQLAETRAQRAEYMQFISELLPPVDLPSEQEMAEQMKNLIPAEQAIREIREARKSRESNGP